MKQQPFPENAKENRQNVMPKKCPTRIYTFFYVTQAIIKVNFVTIIVITY
jgi:hypothetical protein